MPIPESLSARRAELEREIDICERRSLDISSAMFISPVRGLKNLTPL